MRCNTDATARGGQDVRSGGRLGIDRRAAELEDGIVVKLEAWALRSRTM